MSDFADYIKSKYDEDPTDWLMDKFIKQTSLKRPNSHNFTFQHEGEVSSLVNKKQMLKVTYL